MTLLAVIANYCSFFGTAMAAVMAFNQQVSVAGLLALGRSKNEQNRELAKHMEDNHKRYFLGMSRPQIIAFWCAIALAVVGQLLFVIDATLLYIDDPTA